MVTGISQTIVVVGCHYFILLTVTHHNPPFHINTDRTQIKGKTNEK